MTRKRIVITGATGVMGQAVLNELIQYQDRLDLVVLSLDTKKDRQILHRYQGYDIDVIWGDLRDYSAVKEALEGADTIIHLGALVSPDADHNPKLAWEVNVGSVENIIQAIDELNLTDAKLVSIGTVAQTGDRQPLNHWGRVGDPMNPSVGDYYAVSKIAAERKIIESDLKYWVSLRQTGILHPGLLDKRDSIMFHQSLNNTLEWITDLDSARMIAGICLKQLPSSFWNAVYNVGGGKEFRFTNYEFMTKMFASIGIRDIKKIFEPNWFAKQNFHGQYYLDSDILNEYLNFRKDTMEGFLARLNKELSFKTKLLRFVPRRIIKDLMMKPLAQNQHGPLFWMDHDEVDKIEAFYGSRESFYNENSWDILIKPNALLEQKILSHGYDESLLDNKITIKDLEKAAKYRGGKCLSPSMNKGDLTTKLYWECAFGHQFKASPYLILKTGHWCEECEAPPWRRDDLAKDNQFYAQVIPGDDSNRKKSIL